MGRIQSILSFSAVDGPGARCVVFFQGCPVGCVFCHNPDSWDSQGGEEIQAGEVLRRIERFRPFLTAPGVTFSGGEPLFQADFALELARICRTAGWHTALDTSGWGPADRFVAVASAVDLVMFSVKHPLHPEKVSRLGLKEFLRSLNVLAGIKAPVWLRYVLIAGLTDDPGALSELGRLAAELPNLQRVEILPYNSLAENKWNRLGQEFPLLKQVKCPKVAEDRLRQAEELAARCWEMGRR